MPNRFIPNVTQVTADQLRFRWFTCNCFQFLLPGGESFVVDPMLIKDVMEPFRPIGYTVSDLAHVDHIFINHGHLDHIASLKETYETYRPRILAKDTTVATLSRDFDIPQTAFFPYTWNQTYDFGAFAITTLPARHNGSRRPSDRYATPMDKEFITVGFEGTLFNTNFILEARNHLRIGFCAGTFNDGEIEKNCWKDQPCHIFIRQYGGRILKNDPEGIAKEFMETGAFLLLPMHQERFYSGALAGDMNTIHAEVNRILEREGYWGRAIAPQCGKWYTVCLGAELIQ